MEQFQGTPLISEPEIQALNRNLAEKLNASYPDIENPVLVLVVLKGALFFAADLLRYVKFPCRIEFLRAASYQGTTSSGEVVLEGFPKLALKGEKVLILDEILDTGLTLKKIVEWCWTQHPKEVKSCVLLDKPSRRKVPYQADHVGKAIEDVFVVGYGLDFQETCRNHRDIWVLETTA